MESIIASVQTLSPLIERIIACRPDDLRSYQDFYSSLYFIMTSANKRMIRDTNIAIYDYLNNEIEKYTISISDEMKELKDLNLEVYFSYWSRYYNTILRISVASNYYQRTFIKTEKLNSIVDIGIEKWKYHTTLDSERSINMMISLYRNDRDGIMIDTKLLKSVIECFDMIKVDYMTSFLSESHDYYCEKLLLLLQSKSDLDVIVDSSYRWVKSELERCKLLSTDNAKSVMNVVDTLLISEKRDSLRDSFDTFIKNDDYANANKVYTLMRRINGLCEMLDMPFQNYIVSRNSGNVEELLDNKEKETVIIVKYLGDDEIFRHSLIKAYKYIMNTKITMSDVIDYVDGILRKNSKYRIVEEERCKILEGMLNISVHFESKDEFLLLYTKKLSDRLLHLESYSNQLENLAFQTLKKLHGLEHTQKLKVMFEDMVNSTQMQTIDSIFNPIVLTTSIWNLPGNKENPNISETIRAYQDKFSSYYAGVYPKRKVNWSYENSTMVVGYMGYQLTCSFYQYVVLEQFNKKAVITRDDLNAMTNIKSEDVVNSLLKIKVLWPSKDGTKLTLNPKFKCEISRVNCMKALTKEVVKETVNRDIDITRKVQIYSTIVCNMKKNKIMNHNDLMCEVFKQLEVRFKPTVEQFKHGIDYCIEKEYIKVNSRKNKTAIYEYIS